MSIKVVINGSEVKNPIAKLFFGSLAIVILSLLGVVFVVFILPLIGITLALSYGLVAIIVLVSAVVILVSLMTRQDLANKQKRLKDSEQSRRLR